MGKKVRVGDWEAGIVIDKGHQEVLLRLAERVSTKTLITHAPSKHAEVVKEAIITLLESVKALSADNYFAHSYCS